MTDKEKLIEILRFWIDKYFLLKFEAEIFAELLIANGVTFETDTNVGSAWISVKDKLPENRDDVLVCAFLGGEWCTLLAWYGTNGRRWHVFTGVVEETDLAITHWMPLPEPPKEE